MRAPVEQSSHDQAVPSNARESRLVTPNPAAMRRMYSTSRRSPCTLSTVESHKVVPGNVSQSRTGPMATSIISRHAEGEKGKASWYV